LKIVQIKKRSSKLGAHYLTYENQLHESGFAPRILTKLRFENSSNKKTLKQAWRFFI
jgi:hypothetical protein